MHASLLTLVLHLENYFLFYLLNIIRAANRSIAIIGVQHEDAKTYALLVSVI